MLFKDRVKGCRLLLGLSQRQLALRLQVTHKTVFNWETVGVEPQAITRIGVATVLDRLLAKKALTGQLSSNLTTEIEDIANEAPYPCEPIVSTSGGDEKLSAKKLKSSFGENGTNGKKTNGSQRTRRAKRSSSSGISFEFGEQKKRI